MSESWPSDGATEDDLLALALACGNRSQEAAALTGVSTRTVCRRLESPDFRRLVRRYRLELFESASGKLADAMATAAAKLVQLLEAKSEHVQLGAAGKLIELALRCREQVDLEERVTELERLHGGQ